MPASICKSSRGGFPQLCWPSCAFRFVVENQACKKEAFGEEIDTNGMKQTGGVSKGLIVRGTDLQYPQEEAHEEEVRSLELDLLPHVDILYFSILRGSFFSIVVLQCDIFEGQ